MIARTSNWLVFGMLLAGGQAAWAQGVYPYPYAGRPSGPRTVYYPAQPVQAAAPVAVPPPANAIPVTAGYASAAYAPAPYSGWSGPRTAAPATPLTWFPNTNVAPAPVVTGYAPAATVAAPQAYIKPAGGGLIPAPAAAPVVATPAPPVVSIPSTAMYAPQTLAAPTPLAPVAAAPVTAYAPVTAAVPASGGYFPVTVPGAAVGTTSAATPGYVAYSNPYAKYYVPPVFAYRPYSKSVPVTYYRPVAAVDPASGQQVTYMAPCVGIEQQATTTRRVFAFQQPAATCGPQGCGPASCGPQGCRAPCASGTCGAPSPYYQPAPVATPGVIVPGAGIPAATIPPSLPPSTVIPTPPPPTTLPVTPLPSTTLPSTTVPPRTLPSTTVPATPLPSGSIPAAPTFPGFNLPRTTIPPPATVFPGTSGATVVPPTTIMPGTSSTIRSVPGGSGADLAPRLDPNYVPSTPSNSMYPPIDDGAGVNRERTGVSPDAVIQRSDSAATASERPLVKIPFHASPAQPPAQPPTPAPTGSAPPFSAPLNGKTISEPGAAPRIKPVPDPEHPPVYNRAPALINPRDKTA